MISAIGARPRDSALTSGSFSSEHTIAVVAPKEGGSALGDGHAIGLAAQGMHAYIADGDGAFEGASAIWAPHVSTEELARLAALTKLPVLSDIAAGETERLAALLRAGAAEVLVRPVKVEELAKKLARAIRKNKR